MGSKPRQKKHRQPRKRSHGDGLISNLGPMIEGAKDALLRGELDAAEEDLRGALDLLGPMAGSISPMAAMAHGYLGHVYSQRGKPEETFAHYQRAVAASPLSDSANKAIYLDGQAGALAELNRLDEAVGHAETALETAMQAYGVGAAELIHYTASLGFLCAEVGDHEKVIKILETTVALCKKYEVATNLDSFYVELGLANRERGNLRPAIRHYESALEVATDKNVETTIHEVLAELYTKAGAS